ncbi:MAG: biopolymer transporter ExbD [Ferruginibacter sp.]
MAEIQTGSTHKNRGTQMQKKPGRVDLTPMVDLGFLLLSFFVFTSAMQQPKVLAMIEPYDKMPINDKLCNSCVLTVIPDSAGKIFYYEGQSKHGILNFTGFYNGGIRKIFREKHKAIMDHSPVKSFFVIIKPTTDCDFKSVIALHDECTIAGVTRYYMSEPDASDKAAVKYAVLSLQHDK